MQITLTQPDDWHLHLRDGEMLNAVVGSSAAHFGRALIMPNLVPPVVTAEDAREYKARIETALHRHDAASTFTPLMTLYLTETTDPADVVAAAESGTIIAVKLYPAGATTNSSSGVTDVKHVMPVLQAMADHGVVLCVHGEVTNSDIDIFDREARFIETVLEPLRQEIPELRVVMEHVTTKDGVDYVSSSNKNLAATITTHHLMINRNHLLVGGIRPHYYCLPIAKRELHRQALVKAACSGDERFFLGTDSAPHLKDDKESDCGCAGVFNAANTLVCLASNTSTVTLEKSDTKTPIPEAIPVADDWVIPFDPARDIYWQVK